MYLRTLALGLALMLSLVLPAQAQRGGGGNWELLAEEKVGFGADRDIITLNRDENFYRNKAYRRLRFIAQGGEVRMRSVRLVYLNGYQEDFPLNQNLRPGQQVELDLRGERSYLRHIEMNYRSKFGISIGGGGIQIKQAKVQVFGDNVRGGRPGPGPAPRGRPAPVAGWNELDVQRFDRRKNRVVMPVGRREGAIGQVLLRSDADTVHVNDIQIVYGNGQIQRVRLNQKLAYGEASRPIDLEGDRRFIQRVVVDLDGRGRAGPAVLALFGKDEPRRVRPTLPRGWQVLGDERFNTRDGVVTFKVGRREGRWGQIRIQSAGDKVTIEEVRVRFGNGRTQAIRVGRDLREGESTPSLDLQGDTRFIDTVTVDLRGSRRPGQGELILIGSERGGGEVDTGGRAAWVPLGQVEVGFRVDRHVIRVGRDEDWFRNRGFDKLHFAAERNDVHMMSIRVVYLNGYAEDYAVDRLIRAGSDLAVDLRGSRSYIREIEMVHRKRSGFGGRAVVKVFGEPARRR